jgi:hypothetical protein
MSYLDGQSEKTRDFQELVLNENDYQWNANITADKGRCKVSYFY